MHGCKCPSCYGLAEHLSEQRLPTRGLQAAPGHQPATPLKLTQHDHNTTVLLVPDTCDGTMTCNCAQCQQERAARIRAGGQGNGNASPFKHAA